MEEGFKGLTPHLTVEKHEVLLMEIYHHHQPGKRAATI